MCVSIGKYSGKINIGSFEKCTRIPVFIRLGCQILHVVKVQNVSQHTSKTSIDFQVEKSAKNEPKRTPKRDPNPPPPKFAENGPLFQRGLWAG